MALPLAVFSLLPIAREEPAWHLCQVLVPSNFMAPSSAPCHSGMCPHLESPPGKSLSMFAVGQDQQLYSKHLLPASPSSGLIVGKRRYGSHIRHARHSASSE